MSKRERLCVSYKISPNEEAAVLKSQREERRKTRLIQVREQEKEAARKTREKVRQRREQEKELLQTHIQSELLVSHAAELAKVEEQYSSAVRHIGQGHYQARQVEQEENRLHELRLLLAAKQSERAKDRHVLALKEEMACRRRRRGEKEKQVSRLKMTREMEGKKCREMAVQSSSQPPIIMDLVAGRRGSVKLQAVEGFSNSYCHLPSSAVQRAFEDEERNGPDAVQMAELMTEEMQAVHKHCLAVHEEQREIARLRYIHAISKVKMEKERDEMLEQLKNLERKDRNQRQMAIAAMPNNMYQPVEGRRAVARQQQRDLEQAFERIFLTMKPGDGHNPSTVQYSSTVPASDEATPTNQSETTPINQSIIEERQVEDVVNETQRSGELSVSDLTVSRVSSLNSSSSPPPLPPPLPPPFLSKSSNVSQLISVVREQQQTINNRYTPTPTESDSHQSLAEDAVKQPLLPPATFSVSRPNLSLTTTIDSDPMIYHVTSDDTSLGTTPTHSTLHLPDNTITDSLQDAFLKRKKAFIKQSQQRLQGLKSKDSLSEKENDHQRVRFSDEETLKTVTQPKEPPLVQGPAVREKISKREMRERNQRLYTKLSEVRQRELEKKRAERYKTNGHRTCIYQQEVHTKLHKKVPIVSKTVRKPSFK